MEMLKVGVQPFCPTFVQPKLHFSNYKMTFLGMLDKMENVFCPTFCPTKLHFSNYKMTFLGMLDKMENVFCPTFCPSVGQNTPPYRGEVCFVQLSNVQWRERRRSEI